MAAIAKEIFSRMFGSRHSEGPAAWENHVRNHMRTIQAEDALNFLIAELRGNAQVRGFPEQKDARNQKVVREIHWGRPKHWKGLRILFSEDSERIDFDTKDGWKLATEDGSYVVFISEREKSFLQRIKFVAYDLAEEVSIIYKQ